MSALTESACRDAGTTEAETEALRPSHAYQGKEEVGVTRVQGREEDPGCQPGASREKRLRVPFPLLATYRCWLYKLDRQRAFCLVGTFRVTGL